jgi:23S rRNA (uracil1939-C5)-methyltransferase
VVTEVINPSPHRAKPRCPHFGVCGGCQLQHVSTASQVQTKAQLLQEQLTHHGIHPKAWLAPLVGQAWGYRHKARLAVRYIDKKDTVAVGFREQKNNKIALIETCEVLHPQVGARIHELRGLIESLEARAHIAQIEVAVGDNEVALTFRNTATLSTADTDKLQRFCEHAHFSFYLQSGGAQTVTKIWPQDNKPYLTYSLHDQQLEFQFHPLDFTQVNPSINQMMINQALKLLEVNANDTILDLFCGLGNFTLPLAQRAKHVVGVEGSAMMVKRAYENAAHNAIHNVHFYDDDLFLDFKRAPFMQHPVDKILLDPPRTGAEKVVETIQSFSVKKILYVSCNPATFVRDAAILIKQGFELQSLGLMDMFAHTAHVETMGLFVK